MVTSRMTTAQESPNGHHPLPPPCSLPDLQDDHRSKDSSDNNSNPDSAPAPATRETETFAANAYHVPPKHYAPRANSYQGDDFSSFDRDPNQLPDRCQFFFSDGRQCSMARSEIHPSLCRFHSEREDQLFGDPAPGGNVVGAALDLPELYSACRDLTTAAGVNRALGQVFRLLAQRRISRQEAATFGHLAQLLLRTISAARAESTDLARSGVRTPVESREVMRESGNAESTGLPTPEIGAPLAPRTILREPSPRPSTCRSEAPHSESSSPLETGSATATGPSFAVEPRNSNAAAAGSAQHKSNGAALSHAFSALARSAPTTPSQ